MCILNVTIGDTICNLLFTILFRDIQVRLKNMELVCHKRLKEHFNSLANKKKATDCLIFLQAKDPSMYPVEAISISNLHGFSNVLFLSL